MGVKITWTRCPKCHKLHVIPPMGWFDCSCGLRWNFGWHKEGDR